MHDAVERPVGVLLRGWRTRRRLSQQELSGLSSVSARHVSRVETGKAQPSRDMIMMLADHLDVPLRDRNHLLVAGGFAPRYPDRALDDPDLAVVMEGFRHLLDAHLPYPALLLDDHWDVVDANSAVDVLLEGCAPALLEPPVNVVRLCVHPEGLRPRIANPGAWAADLHARLRHRAGRTRDPRHRELEAEVADLLADLPREDPPSGPVLALELDTARGRLRFFTASAQVATTTDTALEGLHLETFLPADARTRERMASVPGDVAQPAGTQ